MVDANVSPIMTLKIPQPLIEPGADLIARFAAIVGPEHAITDVDAQAPYLKEWRDRYVGRTPVILKPSCADEVAAILRLANSSRVGVVVQGGNTGLVGGQIPSPSGHEILVSLGRMARVREVSATGSTLVAEAGVTLAAVQAEAEAVGRLFPLSLASEGSATVGGVLATNAGGVAVLAYGTARALVSGLEVVLADGRIWNGLRALKKDNTGYDLRDLFVGSEGTLGVITAASLKLVPAPRDRATAMIAVEGQEHLLPLFRVAEDLAGGRLTAFEFMCREVVSFVQVHMRGVPVPLVPKTAWQVLIEVSSGAEGDAQRTLLAILEAATSAGLAADAVVAESVRQSREIWAVREACSEAQKYEGGSIKHDVSVPIEKIPELLERGGRAVQGICPGARPVPFGHFGDGNVHYNVSQPVGMDKSKFLALWEPMSHAVHEVVLSLGGSISAEHGIGQMKRDELAVIKAGVEIDLMRTIKAALDPNGILNPGKVV